MHWTVARLSSKSRVIIVSSPRLVGQLLLRNIRMASTGKVYDKAFINGQWVSAQDGATFPVTNPANGELICSVPDMGAVETDSAVQAAYKAFQSWKKTTAKERSDALKKLYRLMLDNKEELAQLITRENGKPLQDSLGEVMYGSGFVEWAAEEGRRIQGEIISSPAANKRMMVLKQPIGVCSMITPWNFPFAMITRKACPALAAGCTVVLKPSEETPLSALAMAKLVEEAGFPAGVFNVVTCNRGRVEPVGRTLCESPLVTLLSFTGSSATGKILMKQCASTVKRCAMELGGNAPFIVFDSADVDAAVAGAMASKFRCSGQTCVCANRFFIQEGIYDAFVEKLSKAIDAQLKVGDGSVAGVTQGPLINKQAVDKVDRFVQEAASQGAQVIKGGKRIPIGETFYEPTMITGVSKDMLVSKEEIFGPVVGIQKFKTEEEVLVLANGVPAGLAGYVYTQNISQQWRVAEALEFGIVSVNEGLFSTPEAPFGGIKESGLGKEGGVKYGIEEYLESKYMCLGGI